jgi:hypothetical protein
MTSRYELVRPDEVPPDAVVVTVRETHGQPMGEVTCSHCPTAVEYEVADFPRPIGVALERAEELRVICRLARVMIALAPEARWNPDWGELLEPGAESAASAAGGSRRLRAAPAVPEFGRSERL